MMLMLDMRFNCARAARFFLLACLCIGAIQTVRADSATDFFRAVPVDDARTVKRLLADGMNPNAVRPSDGESGLIISLREDAPRVFALLLAHSKINLELQARNGNTALMMAAFKHNRAAVEALLAKGAIVNRPGWTALHYAAAAGDDEIVKLLLEHYAYIDAESPSRITPLMIAAREGHEDTVQLLLEEGADASLKNNEALTALQIAERADKPRIAAAIAAFLAAKRPAAR